MPTFIRTATLAAAIILYMPDAFAQGAPGNNPSPSTASPERPGLSGKPACCNPAAQPGAKVKRPPGLYPGMPLQPGDLGYDGSKGEK
jgi:hypothetical protein